jgi:WD40 repeat protein
MRRTTCLSADELSALQQGSLPEATLVALAGHLEECPHCEAAARALDGESDALAAAYRQAVLATPPPPPEAPPQRVGDYDILGELGCGGMGVVYRARHRKLQRVVALKMLLGGAFARADDRARFRAEAEAVARLSHPHIIHIYEVGEHDAGVGLPRPYFTLELAEGGNLAGRLAGRPQPPRQAAGWLEALAGAADYAHRQGVVHRDLKPSNVLLTADGALKLCDFGVAKFLTGSDFKTASGMLVGTPEYMAPEQAWGNGDQIGPAADIHALGAILYEALTGRPPFQAAEVLDTLEQVRSREPVPPRRLQTAVPRDLETICLKCLQKQPPRRYASAAALADDLRRFLRGEPIVARRTPVWERLGRWALRQPVVAGLAAALVVLAVTSFVLIFWQWRRAETKADAEHEARMLAHQAHQQAVREQARLALSQGLTLSNQGEVPRGLLWLDRALDLTAQTEDRELERAIRVNLADWVTQLSPVHRTLAHGAAVLDLAFTPDGATLLSVGKGEHVRFWNVATGEPAGEPVIHERPGSLPKVSRWVGRVVVNPRDPHMAAAVDDCQAYLWDVDRRRPLSAPLPHPHFHMIWGAAFTPDGRQLVTVNDEGTIRWWDTATHGLLGEPWRHGRDRPGFYTLALSPDGGVLATGGSDFRVVCWDVDFGEPIGPPLRHHSIVNTIAFSPDGRSIVTGTRGGTLHVWDSKTGRPTDLPAQGHPVNRVVFSPDGRLLATGTQGGTLRLWDVVTWRPVGQTSAFTAGVTALAFRPDDQTLAVGLDDGSIHLMGLPQAQTVGPPLAVRWETHRIAYQADGRRLLTGSPDGAQWWDTATARRWGPTMHDESVELTATLHSWLTRDYAVHTAVHAVACSPDGRTVATARSSGTAGADAGRAELWDAATGKLLARTPMQPAPLRGVAYSPDGRSLLTWCQTARLTRLWDVDNLHPIRPLLQRLSVPIERAAFSPDGQTLLVACRNGRARFWDVATDQELDPEHCPSHAYPITAVAYDPTGRRVATGCQAGTLRIWDVADHTLRDDLRGNAGEIADLAFSRDGAVLLTGNLDGTAQFWDVATGSPLGPPLRHAGAVLSVAFHPTAAEVATGSKDGRGQRWRMPSPPLEGDREQIRLRIEVLTGQEMIDERGSIRALGAEAVRERRLRLAE